MRLVTYTYRGTTRLGAMDGDKRVVDLNRALRASMGPVTSSGPAWADAALPPDMLGFLALGPRALQEATGALEFGANCARSDSEHARDAGIVFDLDERHFRLEAPVPRPNTVFAIGLNYADHVSESRQPDTAAPPPPAHPTVFTKTNTSICGPGANIEIPRASALVDWEGELCLVIGKQARHVPASDAFGCIAGYMVGNDVSVRDWQFHAPTWVMGKGFDTHGPTGPWLTTADEVADVANLRLQTWVNDDLKQDANTRDLIFKIPVLIEYLSTAFTLQPGDIVFTGTPAGVGAARKPPEWLKAGDVVRVAITGLGDLVNPVVLEAATGS